MTAVDTAARSHSYTPRGVLKDLFDGPQCRADEVLVAGPAGTGKSMACLEKMHMAALARPGMRGLIVRKTLVSLGSTALVTWRERVAKEAIEAGTVSFYGGSQQEAAQYRYTNGSVVVVGGMDKSIRIMSSEYDLIYVQEATELTVNDWEALTTRLRHGVLPFQQLMADCNPEAPWHWLKQRCEIGQTVMLESRHEDNPTLFDLDGTMTDFGKSYMAKLDALTGVRYHRLRKGLWVAADGLIFEDFDPQHHVVDRFKIPTEWPRSWVVDFGFTNPFVCQMWAEDPDGRGFMYREIYHTGRTVDVHAVDIMKAVTRIDYGYKHPEGKPRRAYHGRIWTEPKPTKIIADHDAGDRALLERELGMSTKAAVKGVADGIQATQARFKRRGDGKARLYYLRDSRVERDGSLADAHKPTCTAEEIVGYVWAPASADKAPKEEPLKKDDHGCDCTRYWVADRDLKGVPRLRRV